MRVKDLREILDMLPDDLLVLLEGTYHVTRVDKQGRRTIPGNKLAGIADIPAEPSITLGVVNRYSGTLWYEPEPSFVLRGRWPRPRMKADDERKIKKLLKGEEA